MNRRERASGWAKQWWLRALASALLALSWEGHALAQAAKPAAPATAPATSGGAAKPAAGTTSQAKTDVAPPSTGTPTTAASSHSPSSATAINAAAPSAGGSAPTGQTAAAPSSATTTPSGASPAPVAPANMDATTYVVRLRDLESRVDELKEQIRRSHTRLSLLSDTILSGGIGGAEADIVFRNEMSNAFRVVSVLFVLDGAVMKKEQDDTGELAAKKTIPVYNGPLTPGDHTLQVVVVFQGHGYGVFSYLRAHKYTTKHTHSFTVTEGKVARIEATAFEKGGVTTPIDQRPNVRFTEKIVGSLEAKTGSN